MEHNNRRGLGFKGRFWNLKKKYIYLTLLFLFIVLVFYHEREFKINSLENLEHHGTVIADSLWKINTELPYQYLTLAKRTEGYERVTVYIFPIEEPFISLGPSEEEKEFTFLVWSGLIRKDELEVLVFHKGRNIGRIAVTILNENVFLYFYELLILFFLGMTINSIIETKNRNRNLSKNIETKSREYQESELRFRNLVDNIPGVSYRCFPDENWRVSYISDEIYRLTGYESIDFLDSREKNLPSFIDPPERERILLYIQDAVQSGTSFSIEHKVVGEKGDRYWVYNIGRGMLTEDGDCFIDGVMIDITERKAVEEEREQLLRQVENKNRLESIGRLAGGIAHDFNNLLTPILGYAEFLEDEVNGTKGVRNYIQQIIDASLKSKKLIHQLLSYSKAQQLDFQILDLNQMLSSFRPLLEGTLNKKIELKMILESFLPNIKADGSQIEQVIMNLAVNAMDAMPDGGIFLIETSSSVQDYHNDEMNDSLESGDYVFVTISDTGKGLDDIARDHLFEPFFSTKGDLGTGLGLSIAYGIMKQHHGDIWIKSRPGKGTSFYLMFPVGDQR